MTDVILGSASPRRQQILGDIYPNLRIIKPDIDEIRILNEAPDIYAVRMADKKMDYVITKVNNKWENFLSITSDTIVCIDDVIFGKPSSRDDAINMLGTLSGRWHNVITAISLYLNICSELIRISSYEVSRVKFKVIDQVTINNYLDSIDFSDKAGSYAVQEHGDSIIESIDGSVTNVIGLPLRLFFSMMIDIGAESLLLI